MNEKSFWEIIDTARKKAKYDNSAFIEGLKKKLLTLEEEDIISFEQILRDAIFESDSPIVMAAQSIITGVVTDDTYLFFRAWIISLGSAVFSEAIDNPDVLAEAVSKEDIKEHGCELEELLLVTTDVFMEKTGRDEDEGFPRNICIDDGLDYDFSQAPKFGNEMEESELPRLLPKLYEMFYEEVDEESLEEAKKSLHVFE